MKRDCVFLLADTNMRATFEGFFSRRNFHLSLGCGRINVDPMQDLIVAAGHNDIGRTDHSLSEARSFVLSKRVLNRYHP